MAAGVTAEPLATCLRLGARLGSRRAGLIGPAGGVIRSAAGGAVRDQPGDSQVGLAVGAAAAEIALQGAPLLVSAMACSMQMRRDDCCFEPAARRRRCRLGRPWPVAAVGPDGDQLRLVILHPGLRLAAVSKSGSAGTLGCC